MSDWYIIYVHLGKEEKVAEILRNKLPMNLYRPFIPQKEKFFRRSGVTRIEKCICFPSYVFIESNTTSAVFNENTALLIRSIKEIYAVLNYGEKDNIAVTERERVFLKKLLGNDDCIRVSSGNIIDGNVHIVSGALVGMENLIKKINRHNKTAEIEIMLMGKTQRIVAWLEITSKN